MDVVFKTEFTGTSPVPVSSDTSSAQSYDPGADYAMAFYEGTTAITKKEDFEEKATCIYDAGTTHVTPDALYVDCGPYTTLDRGGGGLDVGQPMDSSPTSQSITLLYDQKMSLSHPISKHQPSKPIHKADPNFAAADSNSSTPSKTFVPCKVCGDKASGYHYGVTSCEGCKGFFRRSIQKQIEYRCLRDGKCLVIRLNRNRCQFCRFKKCISVGMSRDSVRYGRVPKRTRQQSEEARVTQSEADQSTRDMENKQLAIYDIILTISQAHHANCAYTEEKTRGLVRKLAVFSLNDGSPSDGEEVSGAADSLEQQKIVMWQHFAMFVTPSIQRVVEFSKRVPGFSDLSQDDQLILIKCGFLEVWIVHVSRMINNMDNTLTFNDGSYITRQQMDLMFDDEFTSLLFNFSVQFNAMQLNDTELGLFSAIVVLTSDRPGITDQKHIEQHQDKLMEALKLQVARNHVNDALAFSTLLMKVPELRTLGSKHAEHLNWFRQNWAKLKLPPLYAEIFDIPKSEEDLQYI